MSMAFSFQFPDNRSFDVVGIGRNSWDRIALVSEFPEPDTKVEVLQQDNQTGGQVATTMVTCTRLDLRTRYLGKFGDDAGGRAVRGALVQEGIDLSECRVVPGVCNQSAFILVDQKNKTRNVFTHLDSRLRLTIDDFSHEAVTSGKVLYIGGRTPKDVFPFAKLGQEAGCLVVVDADSNSNEMKNLLSLANVVLIPEPSLLKFTKEPNLESAIHALAELGPDIICCTQGENGACAWIQNQFFESKSFDVEIVDTTGAGDVFHGAFLFGLLQNFEPRKLLQFANAAAGLKCMELGGQKGIKKRNEVEKFLEQHV